MSMERSCVSPRIACPSMFLVGSSVLGSTVGIVLRLSAFTPHGDDPSSECHSACRKAGYLWREVMDLVRQGRDGRAECRGSGVVHGVCREPALVLLFFPLRSFGLFAAEPSLDLPAGSRRVLFLTDLT